MAHRLILAGTHSGAGKTTVALALMAALRRRGLVVQPFKVGPDFIDPGHHAAACGRPAYNLDTWMAPEAAVRSLFQRAAAGADAAVVEGVMGLFDGRGADDPRGSTADLARLLGCPVVLVIDASGVAASVAAVVKGFSEFDSEVRVAGVLCNRVAGPRHYAYLEPAIRRHTRVVPLGWLPRRPEWQIPERHLGLTTREDWQAGGPAWQATLERMAAALEETVDVDALLQLSAGPETLPSPPGGEGPGVRGGLLAPPHPNPSPPGGEGLSGQPRVAVARDAAFCFYYQENLEILEEAGAEVVAFSPLADGDLPAGADLVYLGGGYPELHAERLAANRSMREALRRYQDQGGAIYAECGGLMYCCREVADTEGRVFPMLDLLPARAVMQPRRAALGYVTWRADAETLLGPPGTAWRGHEYHYSRLEPLGSLTPRALLLRDGQEPRPDGFVRGRLLAGYAHLYFASNPGAVRTFLDRCRRGRP